MKGLMVHHMKGFMLRVENMVKENIYGLMVAPTRENGRITKSVVM